MFTGTYTALVTPFRDGNIDAEVLYKLVERQIEGGVDGICPVGTTGESPTVTVEEHIGIIEICVQAAQKKIKVIPGTGGNSTAEAIHLTQAAENAGADGSLQVAPYYNKPSQEGLYQHFRAIAESTGLPLILYSIPGRCGIEIGVDTVARLANDCKNIVAIKEAGGSADRVSQLRQAVPKEFTLLSGDDSLTLPFMAVGAEGVVSVVSNLIPAEVSQMVKAFASGAPDMAMQVHEKYYPLFKNMFIETNPVPVKCAMAFMGMIQEEYRLPLVPASEVNRKTILETLQRCELVEPPAQKAQPKPERKPLKTEPLPFNKKR
jgi:4-hydroxy-tetrahydrodipicolinate synthase